MLELESTMENWKQDHPERNSNFGGLYAKGQPVEGLRFIPADGTTLFVPQKV